MQRGANSFAATVVTIALGWSLVARAEPTRGEAAWATVRIHAPECETAAFRAKAFLQLLDVELVADHLRTETGDAARSAELTVTIDDTVCDAAQQALAIRLSRGGAEGEIKRFIELGDVAPNARPRALALAVAEHIRQTRASPRLAASFDPGDPSADAAAHPFESTFASEPAHQAPTPRLGADVAGSGAWRNFFSDGSALFGAQLSVSFPIGSSWLRCKADFEALFDHVTDQLGTADLSYYSAGIAALATTRGSTMFFVGPRLELGRATIAGGATVPPFATQKESHAIVLVSGLAGTRLPIGTHWGVLLEIEMGVAALGIKVLADDRAIGSLDGVFASARAGIAFAY